MTFWTPPTLETPRLVLRPITEADAADVFAACSLPEVTRFTLFDAHRSVDDSLNFIRQYVVGHYAEMIPDPLAITLKSDPHGALAGAIGCHWASRPHCTMELGYWVAKYLWGRGVATEAVTTIVRHVFAHYPVERVQARVIVGNAGSGRVLEKAGFRLEGTMRSSLYRRGKFEDLVMYSLLRSDSPTTQ